MPTQTTMSDWTNLGTEVVTIAALVPGDVIYLGPASPAPFRLRHKVPLPSGSFALWVTPALRSYGGFVVEPQGVWNATDTVRRVVFGA
jgi:hypothetical protein